MYRVMPSRLCYRCAGLLPRPPVLLFVGLRNPSGNRMSMVQLRSGGHGHVLPCRAAISQAVRLQRRVRRFARRALGVGRPAWRTLVVSGRSAVVILTECRARGAVFLVFDCPEPASVNPGTRDTDRQNQEPVLAAGDGPCGRTGGERMSASAS